MTGLWLVSYIALWILFLVIAVILVSILRNLGAIYEALEGGHVQRIGPIKLIEGKPVPDLTLYTLSSDQIDLSTFLGMTTVFAIISTGCSPCRDLLNAVATQNDPLDIFEPAPRRVIVCLGTAAATMELIQGFDLPPDIPVFIAARDTMKSRWGIAGTPTRVLVDKRLAFIHHEVGFTPRGTQPAGLATNT